MRDEANTLGAELAVCEAFQDPRAGMVVRWRALAKGEELSERLDRYTFKHEQTI